MEGHAGAFARGRWNVREGEGRGLVVEDGEVARGTAEPGGAGGEHGRDGAFEQRVLGGHQRKAARGLAGEDGHGAGEGEAFRFINADVDHLRLSDGAGALHRDRDARRCAFGQDRLRHQEPDLLAHHPRRGLRARVVRIAVRQFDQASAGGQLHHEAGLVADIDKGWQSDLHAAAQRGARSERAA